MEWNKTINNYNKNILDFKYLGFRVIKILFNDLPVPNHFPYIYKIFLHKIFYIRYYIRYICVKYMRNIYNVQ